MQTRSSANIINQLPARKGREDERCKGESGEHTHTHTSVGVKGLLLKDLARELNPRDHVVHVLLCREVVGLDDGVHTRVP